MERALADAAFREHLISAWHSTGGKRFSWNKGTGVQYLQWRNEIAERRIAEQKLILDDLTRPLLLIFSTSAGALRNFRLQRPIAALHCREIIYEIEVVVLKRECTDPWHRWPTAQSALLNGCAKRLTVLTVFLYHFCNSNIS